MAKIDYFIGDKFSLPERPEISPRYLADKEAQELLKKYRTHLNRILKAQIIAFNAKSGEKNLLPSACYVYCNEDGADVAQQMPDEGPRVVMHEMHPIEIGENQAVFTYGW